MFDVRCSRSVASGLNLSLTLRESSEPLVWVGAVIKPLVAKAQANVDTEKRPVDRHGPPVVPTPKPSAAKRCTEQEKDELA